MGRLLQTSLSGNARIAIVCTVSPEARHGVESVSTLKFAQRASKVVTKAERGDNLDPSEALIASLERELDEVKAKMRMNAEKREDALHEGELESERQKVSEFFVLFLQTWLNRNFGLQRVQAELEAEDLRLENIRLHEQVGQLSGQIVTASTASRPISYTPSIERNYGDLGPDSNRPAGPRAQRRISEASFIGTPLSKMKTGNSYRSFSSNLEVIKSPSLAGIDRVVELEKEVELLRREKLSSAARIETDLREEIDTLRQELIHVHEKMK